MVLFYSIVKDLHVEYILLCFMLECNKLLYLTFLCFGISCQRLCLYWMLLAGV